MTANARVLKPEEYFIDKEPYYEPVGDEIVVFDAAYHSQLPILLKGPIGCGKTRFMEHTAWRLKRPLITVSCHDDLTASALVGRYLATGGETVWIDGPLARLVKFAQMTRNLKDSRLDEGASTRLPVYAAKLIVSGVSPVVACQGAVAQALTDDAEMLAAVSEPSASVF